MPETTPLIKAALNLRGGAGFDVYEYAKYYTKMSKDYSFLKPIIISDIMR